MRKIILTFVLLAASLLFYTCLLYSQLAKIEYNNQVKPAVQWIDGTPLLKKQKMISENFYKNNPDFLKRNKLNKTTGWNFSVGSQKEWYTVDFAIEAEYSTATTCRAVGKYCYVFVEDAVWNNNINQSFVNAIVEAFDNSTPANSNKGIFQTDTATFGQPPDIDNDQKIVLLLLDIKDNSESGVSVAGFFSTGNEVPLSEYDFSNEAEIFFINVDPNLEVKNYVLPSFFKTITHEFQHLIAWNYDKEDTRWTFINEGCSLASEVINGYPIYIEHYFCIKPNHYMFDWRYDTFDVLADYSRVAKFHVYLYDQFGPDIFKYIVQSNKPDLESYNYALSKLGSNLKINDVIKNWFLANNMNDRSIDPAYGYIYPIEMRGVCKMNLFPGNYNSGTVDPYSVEYIDLESGKNVRFKFTTDSKSLKIAAVFYGLTGKKVVDISPNTTFTDAEFGTKYKTCTLAFMNFSSDKTAEYSCDISGERSSIELRWHQDGALGFWIIQPRDVTGSAFDAVPWGKLDSVRFGVLHKGEFTAQVYSLPMNYGGRMPDNGPTPLSKKFTLKSDREPHYPIRNPENNWVTKDLRDENIRTDKPFYIGIDIPADTSTSPLFLASYYRSDFDYYDYQHVANLDFWTTFKWPLCARGLLMISAFVSFDYGNTSKVNEVSPITYSLSQNYPNPFNPETSISFSIPKKGLTTIKIYDLMGKEVKTLVNEVKEAGDHIVKFSAENLSSGVYFYKIQCDDFVSAKKMVLMR